MTGEQAPRSTFTWGLDMSTSKAKTAAVALEWTQDGARVAEVRHPLAAVDIAPLIARHHAYPWAVDVPFGWPDAFVSLMGRREQAPMAPGTIPDEA